MLFRSKSNHGYRFSVIDTVKTFALTGAATFGSGNGGSEIYFNHTASAAIGGMLRIANGSGDDFQSFGAGGGTTALHGIAIDNGNGDSITHFFGSTAVNSGPLRIASGSGLFSLRVLNDTFANAGPITIATGEGLSHIGFESKVATTLGGTLTVTGSSGDDTVW